MDSDTKKLVIAEVEALGLEACTNLDRLNFEISRAKFELEILNSKREFFNQFPDKFLKTKHGTFITATDKDHSEHARHAIEERIKQFKKELKKEKLKLAFAPGYEDYITDEPHLKLVQALEV